MIANSGNSPGKKDQGTVSPVKATSMDLSHTVEMSENQQQDLAKSIDKVQAMIENVDELSRSARIPDQTTQVFNLFAPTGLPATKNGEVNEWEEDKIPGKIATLFFNNTAILLRCLDEVLCRLEAPEKYRRSLAALLTESDKNRKYFYQVRQRRDIDAILKIVKQEVQIQQSITEAVKKMNFDMLTRCCFQEHQSGRACDRLVLNTVQPDQSRRLN